MKFVILAVPAVFVLSACGGGSTSEYQALVNKAEALAAKLEDISGETLVLPIGTASYDGVGIVAENIEATDADVYIGDVALDVDFDNQQLQGTMGGFYRTQFDSEGNPAGDGIPVDGGFTISSASVATNFDMDVTGALTMDGVNQDLGGTISGVFGGDNAEVLIGGGTVGNVLMDVDMLMIADR